MARRRVHRKKKHDSNAEGPHQDNNEHNSPPSQRVKKNGEAEGPRRNRLGRKRGLRKVHRVATAGEEKNLVLEILGPINKQAIEIRARDRAREIGEKN